VYPCVRIVLHKGDMGFIQQLFMNHHWIALAFGKMCIVKRDSDSLQVAVMQAVGVDLSNLMDQAIQCDRVDCLRVLCEFGAPVENRHLLTAACYNRLNCLEVVLGHNPPPCPILQSQAACGGHVRFLMRIFRPDAGWSVWNTAIDGNPVVAGVDWLPGYFRLVGEQCVYLPFTPGSLVVSSSNLYCSGPVLLYAAQLRVRLTPLMEAMLQDVRARALALTGCFPKAAHLSHAPGPEASKWNAMARVPTDLIKSIATLARISIVDQNFIK
jgi:hypothetical protein